MGACADGDTKDVGADANTVWREAARDWLYRTLRKSI